MSQIPECHDILMNVSILKTVSISMSVAFSFRIHMNIGSLTRTLLIDICRKHGSHTHSQERLVYSMAGNKSVKILESWIWMSVSLRKKVDQLSYFVDFFKVC